MSHARFPHEQSRRSPSEGTASALERASFIRPTNNDKRAFERLLMNVVPDWDNVRATPTRRSAWKFSSALTVTLGLLVGYGVYRRATRARAVARRARLASLLTGTGIGSAFALGLLRAGLKLETRDPCNRRR